MHRLLTSPATKSATEVVGVPPLPGKYHLYNVMVPSVRGVPDTVFVMAQLRRVLYRPAVRRTTVAIIVVATVATVAGILRATDAARARWGDTRQVAVAERSLVPGDDIDRSSVAVRELPTALLPDDALEEEPVGSVVRYPIAAGEPLVPGRLAPMGVSGAAALVPDGQRAVGLPTSQLGLPPVSPGDLVDILVIVPPGDSLGLDEHDHGQDSNAPTPLEEGAGERFPDSGGPSAKTEPAFPLVMDSRVIDANEQVVTITVPVRDAPRVAYAVASGIVTLALTGH